MGWRQAQNAWVIKIGEILIKKIKNPSKRQLFQSGGDRFEPSV